MKLNPLTLEMELVSILKSEGFDVIFAEGCAMVTCPLRYEDGEILVEALNLTTVARAIAGKINAPKAVRVQTS